MIWTRKIAIGASPLFLTDGTSTADMGDAGPVEAAMGVSPDDLVCFQL